jgi:hypothetical protein
MKWEKGSARNQFLKIEFVQRLISSKAFRLYQLRALIFQIKNSMKNFFRNKKKFGRIKKFGRGC